MTQVVDNLDGRKYKQLMVEHCDITMLIMNEDGIILDSNPGLSELCGLTDEHIIGNTISSLLQSVSSDIMDEVAGNLYASKNYIVLSNRRYKLMHQLGYEIPVEVTIKNLTAPVKPCYLVEIFDSSEYESIKGAFVDNERRLTFALEVGSDGFWEWEINSAYFYASPKNYTMLGYAVNSFPNTREYWVQLINPDDRNSFSHKIEMAKETGFFEHVYRMMHSDGEYRWIFSKGRTLEFDKMGKPKLLLGTRTDITDKIRHREHIMSATMEAEDRARRRISNDIHDGLQQTLTIVSMHLEHVKKELIKLSPDTTTHFDTAWNALQIAITESRSIAHELMPKAIEDYGLVQAVESMLNMIRSSSGIEIHYYTNLEANRLEFKKEVSLYRIVQESVQNIIKHAKATEVSISLIRHQNLVQLMVEDNGLGFRYSDNSLAARGLGIMSMRNRASSIGGTFHIESQPGKGTTLVVEAFAQ